MGSFHLGRLASEGAGKYGDKTALSYRDSARNKWLGISWTELSARVDALANAMLCVLEVAVQDKVAIFSQNMVETIVIDLACQKIRAVAVPLYATSSAEQVAYIVNDAGCKVMFVGEQYQYDQAMKVLRESDVLKRIVTISKNIKVADDDSSVTIGDLVGKSLSSRQLGEEEMKALVEARVSALNDDDLATLIYTSGTSGEPKGVMITHSNYAHQMKVHSQVMPNVDETQTSMMFLPSSHIFERAWDYFVLSRGGMIYVNTNPKEITSAIAETHPNMMCAVPRFWEKVYAGVNEKIEKFHFPVKSLMLHAIKVGKRRNLDYKRLGKSVPSLLEMKYKFYSATLFKLVKKKIGLDKATFLPCAGSALSDQVNEFLQSLGFPIVVGYGLTETTATVACYQQFKDYELSSVGKLMPELEVKIGENDEILIKGGLIAKGYYNKPEINAETFKDGWFHTGDAGKFENGLLYITERIKDLFKTSNGKYIAPQQIENLLNADKYIDQTAVIGNDRKFVTALIVPDFVALREYAETNNISFNSNEELVENEKIKKLFEERLVEIQTELASYEQVKRFTLLAKPFTSDSGELTLTLKLKRKVINQNYAKQIEFMYSY
ncbi:MAG: long-chain fatty acid--CoA ligase [Paludibacteraceae bacterium]|nr:long-chain fatty acid--CoA ligase [Paludibacteraceae bacterium]